MPDDHQLTVDDAHSACQFAIEEAVANERSIIAEMLKDLEKRVWYGFAQKDMQALRGRMGL